MFNPFKRAVSPLDVKPPPDMVINPKDDTATQQCKIEDLEAQLSEARAQLRKRSQKSVTTRPPDIIDVDDLDSASGAEELEQETVHISRPRTSGVTASGSSKLTTGMLRREDRALCRIMYDSGLEEEEIAKTFNRTVDYIKRVISNTGRLQDDLDEDYSRLGSEEMERYPRRSGPRRCIPKKTERLNNTDADDRATKHRRREKTSGGVPARTIGEDTLPNTSLTAPSYTSVLQFLQTLEPDLSRFHPNFQRAEFDDDMLNAIISWPDEDVDACLSELTQAGVFGVAQRFVIKKGLMRMRD